MKSSESLRATLGDGLNNLRLYVPTWKNGGYLRCYDHLSGGSLQ